ncbi:MAG: ABC transporter permease [Microbacterium sp.]|uniref:ABC transporter permease n=1 Tax=Microbacterium sp. TaxID=51671 RepID=UPI0039E3FED3
MTAIDRSAFDTPGRGRGLLDVFRYHYLLRLLIGKSTSLRYRNSMLGWFWSYVRPTIQFLVYYLVVGHILGMGRRVELFPLYLFSGVVVVNLFNEAFGAATRSIVENRALVRKIYLPRELFPIASIVGAFTHFLPQLVILLAVCVFLFGWAPSFASVGLVLGGILLVLLFVLGIGLFFAAINVRFRDATNIVEVVRTVSTWSSPILYTWVMVSAVAENIPWLYYLYMSNPVTIAVEFFHHAFWDPVMAVAHPDQRIGWPPEMGLHTACALGVTLLSIVLGQLVFRRLERTFAQDL